MKSVIVIAADLLRGLLLGPLVLSAVALGAVLALAAAVWWLWRRA